MPHGYVKLKLKSKTNFGVDDFVLAQQLRDAAIGLNIAIYCLCYLIALTRIGTGPEVLYLIKRTQHQRRLFGFGSSFCNSVTMRWEGLILMKFHDTIAEFLLCAI